jgi:hypothetical protein
MVACHVKFLYLTESGEVVGQQNSRRTGQPVGRGSSSPHCATARRRELRREEIACDGHNVAASRELIRDFDCIDDRVDGLKTVATFTVISTILASIFVE